MEGIYIMIIIILIGVTNSSFYFLTKKCFNRIFKCKHTFQKKYLANCEVYNFIDKYFYYESIIFLIWYFKHKNNNLVIV